MKLILSAALAALFLVINNAQATEYTGCLSKGGTINKIAIGSEPARRCRGRNQQEISWNAVGPPGADGADGNDGNDGTNGTNGNDGLDGFVVYAIGDIGPAGGWVFYVTDDGIHGLEAAPADQDIPSNPGAGTDWGCSGTEITGAESHAIGAGAIITDDIIRGCPPTAIAAALADLYVSPSGYFDWYLPTNIELNAMYLNIGQGSTTTIGNVGGFAGDLYWSSTEVDVNRVRVLDFTNGFQTSDGKVSKNEVRAVRAI